MEYVELERYLSEVLKAPKAEDVPALVKLVRAAIGLFQAENIDEEFYGEPEVDDIIGEINNIARRFTGARDQWESAILEALQSRGDERDGAS